MFAPRPVFLAEQQVRFVVEVKAIETLLGGRFAVESDHRIDHGEGHGVLWLESELGVAIERVNLPARLMSLFQKPLPRAGIGQYTSLVRLAASSLRPLKATRLKWESPRSRRVDQGNDNGFARQSADDLVVERHP